MSPDSKKQDSVFLLTLVDFLLQIIFFGLFVYALSSAVKDPKVEQLAQDLVNRFKGENAEQIRQRLDAAPSAKDYAQAKQAQHDLEKLMKKMGISNYVELTDKLSKMVPIDQVAAIQQTVDKAGGQENLEKIVAAVKAAGGVKRVEEALVYYSTKGPGKPHCLAIGDGNKSIPLGTVTLFDDYITINAPTPELTTVLGKVGESYDAVASLPLAEFTRKFSKLKGPYPNCVHSFKIIEKTKFIYARDAFYGTGTLRKAI